MTHNISIFSTGRFVRKNEAHPMPRQRQIRSTANSIAHEFSRGLVLQACSRAVRSKTFDILAWHSSTRASPHTRGQDSYEESSSFHTVVLPAQAGTRESTR